MGTYVKFLIGLIATLCATRSSNVFAQPWYSDFIPEREYHVAANGFNGVVGSASLPTTSIQFNGEVESEPGLVISPNQANTAIRVKGNTFGAFQSPVLPWNSTGAVSIWIRIAEKPTQHGSIVGSYDAVGSAGVGQDLAVDSAGRVQYNLSTHPDSSGCTEQAVNLLGPVITDNKWHHVALILDQSTEQATLYVDGSQAATSSIAGLPSSGCGITGMKRIGGGNRHGSQLIYLNAAFDELAIYTRALTPQEVLLQYNNGQGTYVSSQVAELYHFDLPTYGTAKDPYSLGYASSIGKPGDLFWVSGGEYTGLITLSSNGEKVRPIVFRAKAGQRAHLNGGIVMNGQYNWIWGLEISNTAAQFERGGISLFGVRGARAINNVIYDFRGTNGISSSTEGAEQVIYGNIIYSSTSLPNKQQGHGMYLQNNFVNGYKYVVNNVMLDPPVLACNLIIDETTGQVTSAQNCYNFHAYTQGGLIQGFHLQDNVSERGRFLVGGFGQPADNEILRNNYFFQSSLQLGYRRPTQTEVSGNIIGRGKLLANYFWGLNDPGVNPVKPGPNIITNNTIMNPTDYTDSFVEITTSAYLTTGRAEGSPKLDSTDTFDKNNYLGKAFLGRLYANGSNGSADSLTAWRSLSSSKGKEFDINSSTGPLPNQPQIYFINNVYDHSRTHVVIYNWAKSPVVPIDISSLVEMGGDYSIFRIKETFGTPLLQGQRISDVVMLPTESKEFLVLLLKAKAPSKPSAPTNLSIQN